MPIRFTIRDLLWLAALVAVLAAWWPSGGMADAKDLKVGRGFSGFTFELCRQL